MNLQESIRKVLREETNNLTTILRRVPIDDLEREFKESLDSVSEMFERLYEKNGDITSIETFINVAISMTMDGVHYELYSSMPEDSIWYYDVYNTLKDYFIDRIKARYKKLISKM